MQNLKSMDPAVATGKTKQIFDSLQSALGTVPNLMKVLANSPAALNAYISFGRAIEGGQLPPALREQIAITVATANSCDYCLSAHTALGKLAGLSNDALADAQQATAADPKSTAGLRFAASVVRNRGRLPASEVDALRAAGFGDGEIAELVAVIGINIFTNYFNHIAGTEIDFPVVRAAATAK
jgi:uncharacterized peroxidase-related enzyme